MPAPRRPGRALVRDGAHVGPKGGVTSLGRQERVCPRGARRQGSSSAHLSGAVRPERGGYVAPVPPGVSTAATGVFPAELARAVPAGTRAALVLDGAGRHVRGPAVPANPALIHPRPTTARSTAGAACAARNVLHGRARPPTLAHQPPVAATSGQYFESPL